MDQRCDVQVHLHSDETVYVEFLGPLASIDKTHVFALTWAPPSAVAEFAPDENVLRIVHALGFVCTTSIEVYELEVARGGEGEQGTVVASCEHLGVLWVERDPVRFGECITTTSVIQKRPRRDRSAGDGVPCTPVLEIIRR